MSSDLAKRLRALGVSDLTSKLAADRIEALEGEVKRWEAIGDAHDSEISSLRIALKEAEAEVERLREALLTIADSARPRKHITIYRADGIHSKHDKCEHERVMYDDCDECTATFARNALEGRGE